MSQGLTNFLAIVLMLILILAGLIFFAAIVLGSAEIVYWVFSGEWFHIFLQATPNTSAF